MRVNYPSVLGLARAADGVVNTWHPSSKHRHRLLGGKHFLMIAVRAQRSQRTTQAKHEVRIASVFKRVPLPFLRMIVVHELAHLKEKAHNKAFYNLCNHVEPDYHQLEFEMRLYMTYTELHGPLYPPSFEP